MKKIFAAMFVSLLLVFTVATPAYADVSTDAAKAKACEGVTGAGGSCGQGGASLTKIVRATLNILSFIAGIVGVVMVVISGFKYITSGGDSSSVQSAKQTLIYAIVGLLVVAFSQFIVYFVIGKAAGS